MALCVERAGICADEIFINQLTQKHRALSSGCSGRALRSSGATEAHRSDRARTKTRSRPPIRGLRRPVGDPHSPVLRRRQTPDLTNSDSRPSEPARLASSWPTRKAVRASRGPVGHQRRTQAILSPDVVMAVTLPSRKPCFRYHIQLYEYHVRYFKSKPRRTSPGQICFGGFRDRRLPGFRLGHTAVRPHAFQWGSLNIFLFRTATVYKSGIHKQRANRPRALSQTGNSTRHDQVACRMARGRSRVVVEPGAVVIAMR